MDSNQNQNQNQNQNKNLNEKENRKLKQFNFLINRCIEKDGNIETIKSLIAEGGDINNTNGRSRRTPLIRAIASNKPLEIIKSLIELGADPNIPDRRSRAALHFAIRYYENPKELIEFLIKSGSKIDKGDKMNQTPIWHSIRHKSPIEIMRILIENGADPKIKDIHSRNLLHAAGIYNDNIEVLKFLIQNGAEINQEDREGMTFLCHLFTQKSINSEMIGFAFENGAKWKNELEYLISKKVNLENLKLAVSKGALTEEMKKKVLLREVDVSPARPEVIKYLVDLGVDINQPDTANRSTPLIIICQKQVKIDLIKLLVDLGADPIFQNYNRRTAFDYIISNYNFNNDLIDMYKLMKVKICTTLNFYNKISSKINENNIEDLKKIYGDYLSQEKIPESNLVYITRTVIKNKELLSLVLEKANKLEIDLNKLFQEIYLNSNSIITVETFLDFGMEIEKVPNSFYSPLHLVCSGNYPANVVDLLLQKGSKINSISLKKQTPLMLACRSPTSLELVSFLIEKGADLNMVDNDGNTAYFYLGESVNGNEISELAPRIADFLEEKGADIHHINSVKENALTFTLKKNYYSNAFIEYLIGKNIDTNLRDIDGNIAVFHYIKGHIQNVQTLESLLDKKPSEKSIKKCLRLFFPISYSTKFDFMKVFFKRKLIDPNLLLPQNNTILHEICRYDPKQTELIHLMMSLKPDVNALNQDKNTPMHFICESYSPNLESMKILLQNGYKVDQINNKHSTELKYLVQKYYYYQDYFEQIHELLKAGADPNRPSLKNSSFLFSLKQSDSIKIIGLLLWYGADQKYVTQEKLNVLKADTKILMKTFSSYQDDFLELFKRQELVDYNIQCLDGKLSAHKLIIELRIGEANMKNFVNEMGKIDVKKATIFMEFLYSGRINIENYFQNKKDIQEIATNIGFNENWEFQKRGKIGLLRDLRKLYTDEKTKDFTVIFESEGEKIKVHRLVLCARSDLFHGMFISVNDDSNQVNNYGSHSFKTFQHLVFFIYNDYLQDFPEDLIKEIQDAKDYYQLNINSSIDLYIEKIYRYFSHPDYFKIQDLI